MSFSKKKDFPLPYPIVLPLSVCFGTPQNKLPALLFCSRALTVQKIIDCIYIRKPFSCPTPLNCDRGKRFIFETDANQVRYINTLLMKKIIVALLCLIFLTKIHAQSRAQNHCRVVVEFTKDKTEKISAKVIESVCGPYDSIFYHTLNANLNKNNAYDKNIKPGKYIASASYVVDKNGVVSGVRCVTDPGFGLCMEVLRILKKSPVWLPAEKYGHDAQKELFQTVSALDSTFFAAYNNCDLNRQAAFYSDKIEFYHDKTGLDTSKKFILENTQKYICGKVTRELVKGSLEVSPVPGYGAVEMGSHLFHNNQEPNDTPHASKFVIIWKNTAGIWTIEKVISLH